MRLAITGGGTGGHLFPGIAVAAEMRGRVADTEILFITTARAIDQQVLRDSELETAVLNCSGLKGATFTVTLGSLLRQPAAIYNALQLLKRFKPDVVFGVGGYVTGPVLVAAKLLGLPICIHEQNAIPGLTNRLTGRLADTICTSIPCGSYFPEKKAVQTGNPVREAIIEASGKKKREVECPTILVLGGSQGAHAVNELVVEAVEELSRRKVNFAIIHQTGTADYQWVESTYRKNQINGTVQPFFKEMDQLYSQADLAVSRAGATTLAELAVMGIPALLIPFPYAADNHQLANANFFADAGGSIVFDQKDLTGLNLADQLDVLLSRPAERENMSRLMRIKGEPEAAGRIVDQCISLALKRKR